MLEINNFPYTICRTKMYCTYIMLRIIYAFEGETDRVSLRNLHPKYIGISELIARFDDIVGISIIRTIIPILCTYNLNEFLYSNQQRLQ